VCKHWVASTYEQLTNRGLPFDPLLFVHDELELETDPDHVEEIESIITEEIQHTGQTLGVKCPLASEAKHGSSWADVH
jgi:DNA polymerase I-like protein with 3'-5' exonuclease and polymerase domains